MYGTVRLTMSQALVRWLRAQHSERDGNVQQVVPAMFGIFGHGNVVGLGQAVKEEGGHLPLYQPKNEQAMVHTALGFAKQRRRLATLACTASIGPGATNMLTGAATATSNRLPVLLLPSDVFATRRQGVVLQQLEHPISGDMSVNDAFRPLSRFFDRISRPEQIMTALPQAMRILLDPADTGAVTISLPQDVQGLAYDYPVSFFRERTWPVTRRPPADSEIAEAARLIQDAEKPFIIAGGGVRYSEAESDLAGFATMAGIPVAETSAGKGSLDGDHPYLAGGIGVNGSRVAAELAADADLVICIGTRLTDFTTGSNSLFQHPRVRFLGINVNATDANKLSATSVVADAREAVRALAVVLAGRASPQSSPRGQYRAWRREVVSAAATQDGEPMSQGEVLLTIQDAAQDGDWIVAAAGWQPGDLLKLWETPSGTYSHIEFGFSCMGHEIPAAVGIRMAAGQDAEVIALIGDGTYLMNPTELVTAVQEGLKIIVVVLDNGGYQSIGRLALANTGSSRGNEFRRRVGGAQFPDGPAVHVDFVANARSMGCDASVASTTQELTEALAAARKADDPSVIVVPISPQHPLLESGVFWDLGVSEVSSDPDVQSRSDAFVGRRVASQRNYQ